MRSATRPTWTSRSEGESRPPRAANRERLRPAAKVCSADTQGEAQEHVGDDSTRNRVWTLPNLLSMLRLAGVPLFLWLVLGPEADWLALGVLMLSGITDFLDGWLARRLGQTSVIGQILDPVADRLYILAVVVGLALRDIIPWWAALSLPLRDLLLWGLVPLLRTRGYSALPVHFLGKAATFNLLYAFPLLLLGDGEGTVATLAEVCPSLRAR